MRMLAVRLDNIIIDEKKIHSNPPRFNRTRSTGAGRDIREGVIVKAMFGVSFSRGLQWLVGEVA